MVQSFSNAYSIYCKQSNLKVGTSFIKLYYDILNRKIRCQNVITSDLKLSFIISKFDDYLKHINLQ